MWALQLLSRLIFVIHRNPRPVNGLKTFIQSSLHGFRLDVAWMTYLFLLAMLFVILAALTGQKWPKLVLKVVLLSITAFTIVISFADAELFRLWGSKFNSQALEFMKHPREAVASSIGASWTMIVISTAVAMLIMLVVIRELLKSINLEKMSRWKTVALAFFAMLIMAPLARGGFQTIPINQSSAYYSNVPFQNAAAVNSSWNFLYYMVEPGIQLSSDELKFDIGNANMIGAYLGHESGQLPLLCKIANPNIVVILLESFSSHVSGFFGTENNRTPFLDSLARTGLAYTRAYAQGDRTAKGLAALLSGWPGQASQTKSILTLPSKASRLPGLPKVAKSLGYSTRFIYGGDLTFDNMTAYLLSCGVTKVTGEMDFSKKERGEKWGAHDQFLFPKALKLISREKKPFFCTILTLSSHEPFEIPGKQNKGTEVQQFLNSVTYTDDCIRKFIEAGKKEEWFKNTLFVLLADHGRKMDLPDMENHQPRYFQIPLIFWGPALRENFKGKTETRICSQTDVPATIMESVLLRKNTEFPFSRNLLNNNPPMSFYQLWDGFGMVADEGHVVWNNTTRSVVESSGHYEDILKIGKSIQLKSAQIFEKL